MNIKDAMFNLILATSNLSGRLNNELGTNSGGNWIKKIKIKTLVRVLSNNLFSSAIFPVKNYRRLGYSSDWKTKDKIALNSALLPCKVWLSGRQMLILLWLIRPQSLQ